MKRYIPLVSFVLIIAGAVLLAQPIAVMADPNNAIVTLGDATARWQYFNVQDPDGIRYVVIGHVDTPGFNTAPPRRINFDDCPKALVLRGLRLRAPDWAAVEHFFIIVDCQPVHPVDSTWEVLPSSSPTRVVICP